MNSTLTIRKSNGDTLVLQAPIENDGDSLAHYGVPGMRWGIRKDRGRAGVPRTPSKKTGGPAKKPPSRKPGSSGSGSGKTDTAKPAERVSDEQLRKMVNRLQMERQYKELTATTPSAGKKFVNEVLTNSGKQVATTFVTAGSTYLIKKAIESKYGKQTVNDMFPKKGK